MSSIVVDPIGSWRSRCFCPRDKSANSNIPNSARRNLYGKPSPGEVSELLRSEEKRRMEDVQKKFVFIKSETNLSSPRNDAEESLIEKEQREYNEKINQSNLVKKFALKQIVLDEKYLRKIANSSYRDERVKPYSKQQASVTDYFGQRKRAPRNMIPNLTMQNQSLERVGIDSNSSVNSNTNIITNNTEPNVFASNNTNITAVGITNEVVVFPTPSRDHRQSQEQIPLHTMNLEKNFAKEISEILENMIPNQTIQDQGLERVGNDSNSSVNSNTNTELNVSASNNTTTTAVGISNEVTEFSTPPRDHQQSQEQISLHTMK